MQKYKIPQESITPYIFFVIVMVRGSTSLFTLCGVEELLTSQRIANKTKTSCISWHCGSDPVTVRFHFLCNVSIRVVPFWWDINAFIYKCLMPATFHLNNWIKNHSTFEMNIQSDDLHKCFISRTQSFLHLLVCESLYLIAFTYFVDLDLFDAVLENLISNLCCFNRVIIN